LVHEPATHARQCIYSRFVCRLLRCASFPQAIKDYAIKMRTAVVPWDTIESCATTAVITGVSATLARLACIALLTQKKTSVQIPCHCMRLLLPCLQCMKRNWLTAAFHAKQHALSHHLAQFRILCMLQTCC
jgi:hypothetical protein